MTYDQWKTTEPETFEERPEERDEEYEAWLASHGLLDPVECEKDAGWENYLREQWEKSNPAFAVEDDDIAF